MAPLQSRTFPLAPDRVLLRLWRRDVRCPHSQDYVSKQPAQRGQAACQDCISFSAVLFVFLGVTHCSLPSFPSLFVDELFTNLSLTPSPQLKSFSQYFRRHPVCSLLEDISPRASAPPESGPQAAGPPSPPPGDGLHCSFSGLSTSAGVWISQFHSVRVEGHISQ